MLAVEERSQTCPFARGEDPRKTAGIASANRTSSPDAVTVVDAATAKAVLRSKVVRQAGFGAENPHYKRMMSKQPVIMIDGDEHRRQRAATVRFFTPKVVANRYMPMMQQTIDRLVAEFQATGTAQLETIGMDLAVTIAAEIVGLTESNVRGMSRRLDAFLGNGEKIGTGFVASLFARVRALRSNTAFYWLDVKPAIRSRRKQRREDVVSHLLDEGYSPRDILIECITYAIAGMITTRQFIVIAFWHLIEQPSLRERFLTMTLDEQCDLLEEVLRTEPIIGMISRRAEAPVACPAGGGTEFAAGTLFEIDIRAVNTDRAAVGDDPLAIDPARPGTLKGSASMFSFGDGVHRCPGAQVAMVESAMFLDRLFRLPGIALASQPRIAWSSLVDGYELSGATIRCDRVGS